MRYIETVALNLPLIDTEHRYEKMNQFNDCRRLVLALFLAPSDLSVLLLHTVLMIYCSLFPAFRHNILSSTPAITLNTKQK